MEARGRVDEPRGPVLHIVVVGFHHKKGCQVEFSYPPLVPEEGHDSSSLPEEWKYLPFLALPDGAHNYQEDSVYFHLPPLTGDMKCVYGVSCYRQIEAKALRVRQADVTRETVQKSVCVLSRVPLYGLLQAKLQLITHAYFEEKDFSQISILKELYDHMNGSLRGTTPEGSQVYLGKVTAWRPLLVTGAVTLLSLNLTTFHSVQVLFYVSPVNRLVGTLMTVLSLFPGMMEHGLADSSHYRPRSSVSEESGQAEATPGSEEFVSVSVTDIDGSAGGCAARPERPAVAADGHLLKPPSRGSPESSESDWETLDPSVLEEGAPKSMEALDSEAGAAITEQPQSASGQAVLTQGLVSGLEEDQYGMPLAIFTKGYLCLPYMALQQHHLLSDVTVRGFVAGATNILFRQQRHLSDFSKTAAARAICAGSDVEEGRIQIQDPELRRLMSLTTADLRFADYLVKHVTENREDVFLDGTGWEGGDEWIRAQFGLYVHSLLATSLQQDNEKLLADYGSSFVSAWKNTHNYRVWHSNRHPAMSEVTPGHPFQGQYSVADVKLKFSHSVQNSERGKKIGNAVMTTSRNVVQTGKAVGSVVTGQSSWMLHTFRHPLGEPLCIFGNGQVDFQERQRLHLTRPCNSQVSPTSWGRGGFF
uniref:AVL9 homolog (S. cerevisiase) n=1 Tax=Scleropages formosus TaxID=113540 RepID=A0A8C9WF03_SCLFO